MAVPTPLVEIGFDLTDAGTGPFLRLDDPVSGKLDDADWVLAGTIFYDVTSKVKSIAVTRGKNRQLDYYETGLANVVFNNQDRTFDPEYAASPYRGQIIPQRDIRISSGGEYIFWGQVQDWNLNYDPGNDNTAAAACSDAFTDFAKQTLTAHTATAQYSGERINAVLSRSEMNWPVDFRDVETGVQSLVADEVADGTNALEYLRTVSRSEPGSFFVGRNGDVVFRDRRTPQTSGGVTLADDGSGIPYYGMKVVYGSELLYNEVEIGSYSAGTVVATDSDSIGEYGVHNLTRAGLLMDSAEAVQDLAVYYTQKYSQPEYRFEAVSVQVDQLTTPQQATVLELEIGDVVEIKFTPGGVAPAISKYAEIIKVDNRITPTAHRITFGFATLDFALLVLDDSVFGKLDNGNALAF
jgi:hypothetical protein